MKKIAILTICILMFAQLYSQNDRELILSYATTDSIINGSINEYRDDFYKNNKYDYQIIEYSKKYLFDTCLVKRVHANSIIQELGWLSKNKRTRQLVVNILLDIYYVKGVDGPFNFKRSDFNIEAKKKIISILKEPKPKIVIDLFLHDEKNEFIRQKSKRIENDAKKIVKKTGQNYIEVYDSIFKSELQTYLKQMENQFINRTSSSLYLAIGWLEMRDQIPFLESQLKDSIIRSKSNYDDIRIRIKASLVRMGLHQYYDDDLKGGVITGWYLRHQEAYKNNIKELFIDKQVMCLSDGSVMPKCLYSIYYLQTEIVNFPKKLWLVGDLDSWCFSNPLMNKPKGYLEEVRKWAKENEGKYKFNPECYMN